MLLGGGYYISRTDDQGVLGTAFSKSPALISTSTEELFNYEEQVDASVGVETSTSTLIQGGE